MLIFCKYKYEYEYEYHVVKNLHADLPSVFDFLIEITVILRVITNPSVGIFNYNISKKPLAYFISLTRRNVPISMFTQIIQFALT